MSAALAACYEDVGAFIDVPRVTTATLPHSLPMKLRLSASPTIRLF